MGQAPHQTTPSLPPSLWRLTDIEKLHTKPRTHILPHPIGFLSTTRERVLFIIAPTKQRNKTLRHPNKTTPNVPKPFFFGLIPSSLRSYIETKKNNWRCIANAWRWRWRCGTSGRVVVAPGQVPPRQFFRPVPGYPPFVILRPQPEKRMRWQAKVGG